MSVRTTIPCPGVDCLRRAAKTVGLDAATVRKLAQRFAVEKAKQAAREQGYRVRERTNADGTVTLTVTNGTKGGSDENHGTSRRQESGRD